MLKVNDLWRPTQSRFAASYNLVHAPIMVITYLWLEG